MKKSDLKNLALMGITGGLILSGQVDAAGQYQNSRYGSYQAQNSCGGPGGCGGKTNGNGSGNGHSSNQGMQQNRSNMMQSNGMMSESELLQHLDAKHKDMYNGMSPEGKQLARQLAGRSCAGKNECKGLNSCKSDENACAGHGACKGQSNCSFEDKNQAVDVANTHMQEKRINMQGNPYNRQNPYQRGAQNPYQRQNYRSNY